jgi:hypothetical protein
MPSGMPYHAIWETTVFVDFSAGYFTALVVAGQQTDDEMERFWEKVVMA